MSTVQERLDRLYRAMEGQHLLYPTRLPMLHDPWQISLQRPTPGWWNHYRVLRCGMLRITIEVDGGPEHRLPAATVLAMADWIRQRQPLPNLSICGSQSPLSPKYPYAGSDVDFVFFVPLEELFVNAQHWHTVLQHIQLELMPQCSETFGKEITCGLLAEEFRSLPAMMDLADISGPDAVEQWKLSMDEVVTTLERRWEEFKAAKGRLEDDYQQIIAVLQQHGLAGEGHLVQIVTDARWVDVTWFTASISRARPDGPT